MGIRYLIGRSGSGKTQQVYREIGEAVKKGENRLILMVPEQFTLQAERDLIRKQNLPGLLDAEVLSFTRLAHKIFNEVGGLTRTHINEQGRHMILRRLLDKLNDHLTVYKSVSRQSGFIEKTNQLLSDLKKHDITPDQLRRMAEKFQASPLLSGKLMDTALIYEAFQQYLEERYMDSEDAINALVDRIEQYQGLNGARIWLDGFDYFPPQSVRVLEKLALTARELTITFTMDTRGKSRDQDVFRVHALSLQKVRRIAKEYKIHEEFVYFPQEGHVNETKENAADLHRVPELAHLERQLYQYPYQEYSEEVIHIEGFAAGNPESEIERLAGRILSLSRTRGWRYREMTVVSGDLSVYGSLIKRVFTQYGIPFFLDEKRPVIQNPIVDLVLSCLRVTGRGYRYEEVFKLLKTGFCGLSRDQTELLENYCLEYGIKGKKWKQPFHLGEKDYPLEVLNDCRKLIMDPLTKLEEALKTSNNIREMVTALYFYLEDIKLQEQLEEWIEKLRQEGLWEQMNENAQIWNIVMETFDQLAEILGDQKAGIDEFCRILESGFASLKAGIIPTTLDQVLIGSIQRSKSQDVKALFVVGCNDGILPAGNQDDRLLSAEERDLLQSEGLDLGGYTELLAADEKFGIYTAFSKPSDFLWISYALADSKGETLRPSILIDRLKRLFPRLIFSSDLLADEQEHLEMVSTPKAAYKYMTAHMRNAADGKEDSLLWWLVYDWYKRHPDEEWAHRIGMLTEGLFHQNQEPSLGREKAVALYSLPVKASVSRLEQYVKCPFAHFVRYGLRPAERKEYTVAAPDLGELFHLSIEKFTARIAVQGLDWRELKDHECESMLDDVMDEILPEYNHGILQSTHRYQYLSKRLKRIGKRAVWLLTDHIRRSKFNPVGHEISFGLKGTYPPIEIELADGEKMLLEGRIDRCDIYERENDLFINVIDYKSGAESFDLSDAWFGLKLQLLVYLEAMLEQEQRRIDGKARPGGIFYFRIDDPLINTKESVGEAIEKEIRKKLKLKGLVLKDVNLIRSMDNKISGYSEVLPVGVSDKNDSIYANSSVLEEEDFIWLIKHIKEFIRELGAEMLNGNINISPTKKGDETACRYCPYDGICQFDLQLENNRYRLIPSLKTEEVIERIRLRREEN